MRPPDRGSSRLRQTEVQHFAGVDQFSHRASHVLDRHLGVDAVLVVQIDMVGPQPAERVFHRPPDAVGAAAHAARLDTVLCEGEPELGSDLHLVSHWFECFADDVLVQERPVHFGGVEEGHAKFDGMANHGDGIPRVPVLRRCRRHRSSFMQPRPISETLSRVPRVRWFMGICPFIGSVVGSGGISGPRSSLPSLTIIARSSCAASGSLFRVMFAMPSLRVCAWRKCAHGTDEALDVLVPGRNLKRSHVFVGRSITSGATKP